MKKRSGNTRRAAPSRLQANADGGILIIDRENTSIPKSTMLEGGSGCGHTWHGGWTTTTLCDWRGGPGAAQHMRGGRSSSSNYIKLTTPPEAPEKKDEQVGSCPGQFQKSIGGVAHGKRATEFVDSLVTFTPGSSVLFRPCVLP